MAKKIRLRFAPSPTGFLHIGNLRSALFGYLLAKSWKGKFILRIEDTDQKREVEGAIGKLLDILAWIGIKFDEGPGLGGDFGPYIQTQRLETYHELSKELIASGQAYRCFCSEERLTKMREDQQANKQAPRYDRLCRHLSAEEIDDKLKSGYKYVIRQKMPLEGEIKVYDELRGEITFSAADLDDQVLIKSDGVPTYQFANIVDDHLMEISHVTRGEEWLPSFPKNILLYQAFGWTPPKFIHLPLILNKGGGKLSKRQGDVFVEDYKNKGYLPEAITNFCALLGWHAKDDQELYVLKDLVKKFSLEGLGSSPAIFDLDKLNYFNAYYLRKKSLKELSEICLPFLLAAGVIETAGRSYKVVSDGRLITSPQLKKVIALAQERLVCGQDITELTLFIWQEISYPPDLLRWKSLDLATIKANLEELYQLLSVIEKKNWDKDYLETLIINYLKSHNKPNGDYLWPLRVSLSGAKNSPSPFEIAGALGKDLSLQRIVKGISLIK
ncbi:MAG: glutamate--tRNA ligase [Patescibacteria group bacterium]